MNGPEPSRGRSAAAGAYALIIVGSIFLMRNLDVLPMRSNWWALLLLVPLFFLGARILDLRTKHAGVLPPQARGPLMGFLSVALVMVIFLSDLDWGDVWPLFIILVGVSFLFGAGKDGAPEGGKPGASPESSRSIPPGGTSAP